MQYIVKPVKISLYHYFIESGDWPRFFIQVFKFLNKLFLQLRRAGQEKFIHRIHYKLIIIILKFNLKKIIYILSVVFYIKMQGKGIQHYISEVKGTGDRNLYKHLSDVLAKILLDNPENSFDIFEDYSHYVKQMNYDYKKIDASLDNAERLREKNGELSGYIEKAKK